MGTPIDGTEMAGNRTTVGSADLNWQLPSPDTIAAGAHEAGLAHAAEKTGLEPSQVLERLQRGDRSTCDRYRYGLAKQVAEAIGILDQGIRSIHLMEYDATPTDVCFCEANADPRIHLVVWTQRRTQALGALTAAIDRALVQTYRDIVCAPALQQLLDVQVVDDAEVAQRSGYGAMLSSIHHRPLPLWRRSDGR